MSGITLQKGDYVVHKDMTFEQYERFHNEAIKQGFNSYLRLGAHNRFKTNFSCTLIDTQEDMIGVSRRYTDQCIPLKESRNVTSYFTQEHLPEQSIRDILLEAHKKIQQQHKVYIETAYFGELSRTMGDEVNVDLINFEGEAL